MGDILFFWLLGVGSALGQGVLLREVMHLTWGNELVYILGLGIWLAAVAAGSFLANLWQKKWQAWENWGMLIGWGAMLPFLILVMRFLSAKILFPGQLPSPFWVGLFLVFPLLIWCLPAGWLFVVGVKKGVSQSLAYCFETIGFFVGGLLVSFGLITTSFPLPPWLEKISLRWRYPALTQVLHSRRQQIVVTKTKEQTNFYLDGQFAFAYPPSWETREFVKIFLPILSSAKKIVVLGDPNLAAVLSESLPSCHVYFFELDAKLLNSIKATWNDSFLSFSGDSLLFFTAQHRWDAVVLKPPLPSSFLANRFYTLEFLRRIRQGLSSHGVVLLSFYLPTTYQGPEATGLAKVIFKTFQAVFPATYLLSLEDQIVLLGAHKPLNFSALANNSLFYYYLQRSASKRLQLELKSKLRLINRELRPTAFFYYLRFWQTIFSFIKPKLYSSFVGMGLISVGMAIVILLRLSWQQRKLGLIALSSFLLMGLETLLMFLFQVKVGYLYSQLVWLSSLALLGIVFGLRFAQARLGFGIYFLTAFSLLFLSVLPFPSWVWYGLVFGLGVGGGSIFANLAQRPIAYGFDVLGGAAGTVVATLFWLPTFGLQTACLFLAVISVLGFIIAKHQEF